MAPSNIRIIKNVRNTQYVTNTNNDWHRIDGPAIECVDGYLAWYINGKKVYGVEEWMEANNIPSYPFTKEQSMLFVLRFGW